MPLKDLCRLVWPTEPASKEKGHVETTWNTASVPLTHHLPVLYNFSFLCYPLHDCPTWQGLTPPGLPLLCTGNYPTQKDLLVHVNHGEGPSEHQFWNRHFLEVLHTPPSSRKTRALLQILRKAELKNCSFYITPSPSLAHLHWVSTASFPHLTFPISASAEGYQISVGTTNGTHQETIKKGIFFHVLSALLQ